MARAQVIHNSADAAAASVDVWLNDAPLAVGFNFRTATPFVDLQAGVPFDVTIQGAGSTDTTNAVAQFTYTLAEDETYILIANGIVSGSGYDPIKPFDIYVYSGAREMSTDPMNVDILAFHGSTDAPTVDVIETTVPVDPLIADFTYEDFEVGEQTDTSRLIIPGITWERTIGRDLRRTPEGHRISVDLRGAHDALGSDTTFLQGTVSTKWIWSPGLGTRFLARADIGATAKQSLAQLPASVRFFAGGDTSVRGYDFETIGPVDDNGDVTGGSHLVALSLEADWKIAGNWAVAAFVDSGSAFNESDPDFKTGVGLGVRWYSPLGPIRIDFAHPLDDADKDFRLHVTLGPDL